MLITLEAQVLVGTQIRQAIAVENTFNYRYLLPVSKSVGLVSEFRGRDRVWSSSTRRKAVNDIYLHKFI